MNKRFTTKVVQSKEDFNLHFASIAKEKEYNALSDPHAHYYFVSKAAKQRLKQLKTEMRQGKKSLQSKEMLKLIKHKIKHQFPQFKLPLLQAFQSEEPNRDGSRMSQQINHRQFTERLRVERNQSNIQNIQKVSKLETEEDAKQKNYDRQLKKSSSKMKLGKSKSRQKQKVNHQEFLRFLTAKKQQLNPIITNPTDVSVT